MGAWRCRTLSMHDLASSVMMGNLLSLAFVWGIIQFNRHDYRASWLAYAAVAMPVLYMMGSLVITEGLPPPFDALALR